MENKRKTNYVIVVDYDENNNLLEDQCLLGWNNKYDWFDCETYGDEILTKTGRVKQNTFGLIDIDRYTSVYVDDGNHLSALFDTCNSAYDEGYNCRVCKIEKDGNDLIIIPQIEEDE